MKSFESNFDLKKIFLGVKYQEDKLCAFNTQVQHSFISFRTYLKLILPLRADITKIIKIKNITELKLL